MNSSNNSNQPFTGEPEKSDFMKQKKEYSDQNAPDANNFKLEEQKINGSNTGGSPTRTNKNEPVDIALSTNRNKTIDNNNDAAAQPTTPKEDLKAVALKLKTQNEKLKEQFKDLSVKLAQTLEKVKNRNQQRRESQNKELSKQEESMMKELETATKQIASYKKEVQSLKNKREAGQSDIRIQTYENKIKERERDIEDVLSENNNLEKLRRDQEKELEVFRDIFNYQGKIKNFEDEGKKLRTKIREMYEQSRNDEKNFKKQQEKLVLLEEKYREACDKLGVSASLNQSKAEETNKLKSAISPNSKIQKKDERESLIKGNKYFGYPADEEDEKDAELDLNERNIQKLNQDCKNLQKQLKTVEGKYKTEFDRLTIHTAETERQRIAAEEKVRDREKEVNILHHRLGEFKRITKINALQLSPKSSLQEQNRTPLSMN